MKKRLFRRLVNPQTGKPPYVPHDGQWRMHCSDARFKFLAGGSRYGKSLSGARDVLIDILRPGTNGWLVGPEYDVCRKEFDYLVRDLVTTLGFRPVDYHNSPETGRMVMRFPWGSEVICKTEKTLSKLLSEEVDWMILCEGTRLKESTYDRFLRARLGTRMGRLVLPSTPNGKNWCYRRFHLPALAGDKQFWSEIHATEENPYHPREDIIQARRELPAEIYQEQYGGSFCDHTGLLYKDFDRGYHVAGEEEIRDLPSHWFRAILVDPGVRATAAAWIVVSPQGHVWQYDEFQAHDISIPSASEIILAKTGDQRIDDWGIDPRTGGERSRRDLVTVEQEFQACGVPVRGLEADKMVKHSRLNNLLKNRHFKTAAHCIQTILQFETIEWSDWDSHTANKHLLDALGLGTVLYSEIDAATVPDDLDDNDRRIWDAIDEMEQRERVDNDLAGWPAVGSWI